MVETALFTKRDLCRVLGISKATLERLEKAGELPPRFAPFARSRRLARWRRTDIEEFVRGAA